MNTASNKDAVFLYLFIRYRSIISAISNIVIHRTITLITPIITHNTYMMKAPSFDKGRGQRGGNVNIVGGLPPLQVGQKQKTRLKYDRTTLLDNKYEFTNGIQQKSRVFCKTRLEEAATYSPT